MPDFADIAVAVLAAGRGIRFGSDKLMANLDGRPLGVHIAQTVATLPFILRFAVCSKSAALAQHFLAIGFRVIDNDDSESGLSRSLKLAVDAAYGTDASALLIVLADMPFVSPAHIRAVVGAESLAASTCGGPPSPPALFPRSHWPTLLETSGDSGARLLLDGARLIHASNDELRDIDVPEDLPDTRKR